MFAIIYAVRLGVLHWEDSNITTLTLNLTLFLGAARIREVDSNIITLKPTLTLYFQTVQYAWAHYTGTILIQSHSNPHSICFVSGCV
jgi:hypothetical protein